MASAKPKIELEDHQRFALMKFRRSVNDVLQPHHDDHFLLRWLRARSWNAEAAEKMLRQSMKWRQEWEVDGALKTWQPPEVLQKYQPSGCCGYDKDGAPVVIVPFSGLDLVGLLHATSKQEFIRCTVQILERNLGLAAEAGVHQVVVIFDMDNFNIRHYTWRPAAECVIQLIQMYEANYPEILKTCYIINAPRMFAIAFNIVKKFMDDYTLSKIQIIRNDPAKWKKLLLSNIEPDNLPKYYGGSLTDPDGNPKYTTKVKQGGVVPKSYFTKNKEKETDDVEFVNATVKKGEKLELKFDVQDEGSMLKWEFRTEDHDIRFGVTVKDSQGDESIAVRHQRVASNQVNESGILTCQAPATYIITFDNTYSFLRNKKLQYNICLMPPLEELIPTEALQSLNEPLNKDEILKDFEDATPSPIGDSIIKY